MDDESVDEPRPRFTPETRALALRVATDALAEQSEALRQVRDRGIAVLGALTAAGALLLNSISPPQGGAARVLGWVALTVGGVAFVAALCCAAQMLRPRGFHRNMSASAILGWGAVAEPDAELAMHLDNDRRANAAVLDTIHEWFSWALMWSVIAVAAWVLVSIAWRN